MIDRVPDFLIIGAMKAGSTTLYADLAAQPSVFMSPVKEPYDLASPDVLAEGGRKRYARLFAKAVPDQICGEASTSYSMLPVFDGVAERARRLLGRDAKIVYIVRNPIERIISQHFHLYSRHGADEDINEAVRSDDRLLNVSRYDMQLAAWLREFDDKAVYLVRFEDFIADRRATISGLCTFLGVDADLECVDDSRKFNSSDEHLVVRGSTQRIISSQFYQRHIRPILPTKAKEALRRWLGRVPPPRPARPSASTLDYLVDELQPSVEGLSRLVGLKESLWNLEETRRQYVDSQ